MIATTTAGILVTASVLCSNANWQYSERCTAPPAYIQEEVGGFSGQLESGVYWSQYWISSTTMQFRMEGVSYLVTKEGIEYN